MKSKKIPRNNFFSALTCIAFLIAACGSSLQTPPTSTVPQALLFTPIKTATPNPTKQLTPTFTATVGITREIIPTVTNTPDIPLPTKALSPYPTLIAQGPYLLYEKHSNQKSVLILTNSGGLSRRIISLPDEVYIPDVRQAVSPDGKWLAFYTGSTDPPYDLTLNLLSIPGGITYPVTKIFSDEHPETFSDVAEFYDRIGYGSLSLDTLRWMYFDNSLEVFDWSPDGRILAFAGQIDGPSSDLYFLDVLSGEIQRMTDDLRILNHISWSPDGEWLVILNTLPTLDYAGATLHRIKANGGLVKDPPVLKEGHFWHGLGWAMPDIFMMTGAPDGGDLFGLGYLDVETGNVIDLWRETYFAYTVDPDNRIVLISGAPEQTPDGFTEYGVYLVSLDGKRQKISDEIFWVLGFRGGNDTRFIGNDSEKIVGVSKEGKIATIFEGDGPFFDILVSPDKNWFVLYEEYAGRASLILFSKHDEVVRSFQDLDVTGAIWRTDSSGLIVTTGNELYSITVPDGELVLIDHCLPDDESCWIDYDSLVWLP